MLDRVEKDGGPTGGGPVDFEESRDLSFQCQTGQMEPTPPQTEKKGRGGKQLPFVEHPCCPCHFSLIR